MAGLWVSFSLDSACAARFTWNIWDIVERHHVDYESRASVNLVDSAPPNGGFNVKTMVGFSFAHTGVKHVDKVEREMSCSGRHKLCALPLMTLPRPGSVGFTRIRASVESCVDVPSVVWRCILAPSELNFDVSGSQIQENLVERWKRFARVASLKSLILRLTAGPFHKLSGFTV